MADENYKKVGKIKDAHGLRGELYVLLFAGRADWLSSLKAVYLKAPSGSKDSDIAQGAEGILQYSLQKAKPHKKGLIVSIAEVTDRTKAESLIGFEFLIPSSYLKAEEGEGFFLEQILHFEFVLADQSPAGQIVGFSDNSAQDLLVVKNEKGEHLVPFVKPLMSHVDVPARKVIAGDAFPRELVGF